MKEAHQLTEGDHVGFVLQTDYTRGSALAIMIVNGGTLAEFWHPCNHFPSDQVDEKVDIHAVRFLKRAGVKTAWTPGDERHQLGRQPLETLLGYHLRWCHNEDNWGSYDPIRDPYYAGLMEDFDINLKYLGWDNLPS